MPRILIAEDDMFSRKICYAIIEKMGHIPMCSPDGRHAYQSLLDDNNFALLITDIMMPEMDGKSLIKTIRGHSALLNLPIIIMSAVVGMSDISDLLAIGADLFLPKPVDSKPLTEYIERSLK